MHSGYRSIGVVAALSSVAIQVANLEIERKTRHVKFRKNWKQWLIQGCKMIKLIISNIVIQDMADDTIINDLERWLCV